MKIVLASRNRKKIGELKTLLSASFPNIEILSLDDVGFHDEIEENGTSFCENALIKARAAARSGYISLGEDSGLSVDALGGEPGIYSARYCEGSDADRVVFLLKNLENVPARQRGAQFVSAIACVYPDGTEFAVRGICRGVILTENRGEGGFGYDPVFFVPQEGETFASMPQTRKNAISHRANSLKITKEELEKRGL